MLASIKNSLYYYYIILGVYDILAGGGGGVIFAKRLKVVTVYKNSFCTQHVLKYKSIGSPGTRILIIILVDNKYDD
jgi:hypothetical protein